MGLIDDLSDIGSDILDEIGDVGEDILEGAENILLPIFAPQLDLLQEAYEYLLDDIIDTPDFETDTERGILLNRQSAIAKIPVLYGQRKIGSIIGFWSVDPANLDNLHIVNIFSEGEIFSFDQIFINDISSLDARFVGLRDITAYRGDQTTVDPILNTVFPTKFGANDIFTKLAVLVGTYTWDQTTRPFQGWPRITAVCRGKKVYDFRDKNQDKDDETTWDYSANPALCILDYLRDVIYGKDLGLAEVNLQSFIEASHHYDIQLIKDDQNVNDPYFQLSFYQPIGEQIDNFFGYSVHVCRTNGRTFVGASDYNGSGQDQGACYFLEGRNKGHELQIIQPSLVQDFNYSSAWNTASDNGGILAVPCVWFTELHSQQGACSIHEYDETTGQYTETAFIKSPNPGVNYHFGSTTWVSGTGQYVFVGEHESGVGAVDAGAIHVYQKTGGNWLLFATLQEAIPVAGHKWGWAFASDETGIFLAVSTPYTTGNRGEVHVLKYNFVDSWDHIATLTPSDPVDHKLFGYFVTITGDGSKIIVGAIDSDDIAPTNRGSVYVYIKPPASDWVNATENVKLTHPNPQDFDWYGVAGNSTTGQYPYDGWIYRPISHSYGGIWLFIGSYGSDGNRGRVFVYKEQNFNQGDYQLFDVVVANTADEQVGALFGASLDVDDQGNYLCVGAPRHDANGSNYGGIFTFFRGTESQYELNGLVNTGNDLWSNLQSMLSACLSKLDYTQGLWSLLPLKDRPPVYHLDIDSNIVGSVSYQGPNKRTLKNTYEVKYTDPEFWQEQIIKDESDTFKQEDNGEELIQRTRLDFETSATRARRRGEYILKNSRETGIFSADLLFGAVQLKVTDIFTVTWASYGWDQKKFRCIDFTMSRTGRIKIVGQEHEASVYDPFVGPEILPPENTDAPDPFFIADPTGLTVDGSELQLIGPLSDGTVITAASVTWSPSDSPYWSSTEIECKKQSVSEWEPCGVAFAPETVFIVKNLEDGVSYDFRIRFENTQRVLSNWVQQGAFIEGKSAPPPDVTGFIVGQNAGSALLKWDQVLLAGERVKDLQGYEIRIAATATNPDWATAGLLNEITRGTNWTTVDIPDGQWTLFIKAVDTSGNYSVNAASDVLDMISTFDIITRDNWRGKNFAGVITNFLLDDWKMRLLAQDQNALSFYFNAGNRPAQDFPTLLQTPYGIYQYETEEIDIDFDTPARAWYDTLGSVPFGWPGGYTPVVEINTRVDGGAYEGWLPWTVGAIVARFVKFRITIDTTQISPMNVHTFDTVIDTTEREEIKDNITINAGDTLGTLITFDNPFHLPPAVAPRESSGTAVLVTVNDITSTTFRAFAYRVTNGQRLTTNFFGYTATGV